MKKPFANFRPNNWKNLILFAIFVFYLAQFAFLVVQGSFPTEYGEDFLGFWSVGKVAAEKGFSQIYNLDLLRKVQVAELISLDLPFSYDDPSFATLPSRLFYLLPAAIPVFIQVAVRGRLLDLDTH